MQGDKMVNLIEILITRGIITRYSLLIVPKENICYLNEKKHYLEKDKINKILSIISLWKNEYGIKEAIDQEEFTITITTNNKTETIHGKGIYPNNYNQLLEIIGEINE